MKWFGSIELGRIYCHHLLDPIPDPVDFTMHTHTSLELFYFVSGRGSYRVEGQMYDLCPGDILIMRPGETHSSLLEADTPYERVTVNIAPQMLSGPLYAPLLEPFVNREAGSGNRFRAAELPGDFIRQCMERLFARKPRGGETQVFAYLLPILQELAAAWSARQGQQPEDEHPLQDPAAQLVAYINLHLTELHSMHQLEQEFFLSQSQINRIFHRFTGTSVWEYVQVKRLFAARELLYAGTPPHAAAQTCGYREYSTFFRAYKKRFGHAPQQDLARPHAEDVQTAVL